MNKVMNILVATDYSAAVMCAEHYAMQMAKKHACTLRFLHVFSPPGFDQVGSFDAEKIDYSPSYYELQKLKAHVAKLQASMEMKDGEVNYDCVVREGSPAAQIVNEVKETYPDLVIMGAHGDAGFREFVLGSQTWKVIKNAGVPVLALPREAYFSGIRNIVYATEYRKGELPVIHYLAQLAEKFKATLTVLHIAANAFTEEFEKKISADFMAELKNNIHYPVQFQVEHASDIVHGIDSYTERHDTDLLAMSHEKPYFLERIFTPGSSVTRKMTLHTHTPLLVIPDYYNPDNAWFWKLFALDYSMDMDF